ncbi:hypothetical protein [Lutibacter sp.]|uniref:hypothetical protein n=1 Tax=Lutibacter sp. TaxID=1925666 RepID=UPI001A1B9F56|nr:hypothetical protein [Lutibacter sp.]MBI9040656.1 hypothetical protein [Lutibacter sp.]
MKKSFIIIVSLIFISTWAFSQQLTIKLIESTLITHQGVEFKGELKDSSNDLYVFDNFNNDGMIYVNNNVYSLSNLNFNVETNSFESRINRNKNFSYRNTSVDSIKINNHFFKKIGNIFYEVLFENFNRQFLKKYDIKIKPGTFNRLDGSTGKPKEELDYRYLIKLTNEYQMIELSKNDILDLFNNDENKDKLEAFVKEERLSYKKEDDIIKIMEFIDKNPDLII